MNRRRFISASVATSAAFAFGLPELRLGRAPRASKRILVLGGTNFLGPAVVEAAVVAGHTVTLFNRGITNPELFPRLEKLRGLRSATAAEENWTAIGTRHWDAIVDVWPSDPVLVESAATLLRDRAPHYLYVSSIAAYDPRGFATPGLAETAPLNPWNSPVRLYNRAKAESERRLQLLVGDRLTVIRPGAIKGARDDTPDLLRWLRRARDGARHIAPGTGEDHVQLIDVKDVARFIVLAIEGSLHGSFNVAGEALTFREFLTRCQAATRSEGEFVWIPADFLHQEGLDPDPSVFPPEKFPLWRPEPERRGFFQVSSQRAIDAGWTRRPFSETALDYLWWFDAADPATYASADPLTRNVEQRVLEHWAVRR